MWKRRMWEARAQTTRVDELIQGRVTDGKSQGKTPRDKQSELRNPWRGRRKSRKNTNDIQSQVKENQTEQTGLSIFKQWAQRRSV